jgi:alpha-L-fucosidase 2
MLSQDRVDMKFETTRRRFIALLSSFTALPQTRAVTWGQDSRPEPALKPPATDVLLWFTQPAPEWAAALPVGNGRMGAMVFGGVAQERIALNEDSLWSGSPKD